MLKKNIFNKFFYSARLFDNQFSENNSVECTHYAKSKPFVIFRISFNFKKIFEKAFSRVQIYTYCIL